MGEAGKVRLGGERAVTGMNQFATCLGMLSMEAIGAHAEEEAIPEGPWAAGQKGLDAVGQKRTAESKNHGSFS